MGIDISVIMPAYNEAANLVELVPQILDVLDRGVTFEIVVVDDGSTDGTPTRHGAACAAPERPLPAAAAQRGQVRGARARPPTPSTASSSC